MSERPYPIGTPGQPWTAVERAQWKASQPRQRSYEVDVLARVAKLAQRFEVITYGEVVYGDERYPLRAVLPSAWRVGRPGVLVTGGVHGYETSGVHGALQFLEQHAAAAAERVNLLVAPCVSPWAYERIHRWNAEAVDPNRAFRNPPLAEEAGALMRLIQPWLGQFIAHLDLHETTDTDETEFRPALAARDGKVYEPDIIPDGFYLVDDSENPQPAFQQALIDAVKRVTHIAAPDAKGQLIGSPMVAPGVIQYPVKSLGLCTSITGARYTTTTEVYPNGRTATPEQCNAAQVAAVHAAIEFVSAAS